MPNVSRSWRVKGRSRELSPRHSVSKGSGFMAAAAAKPAAGKKGKGMMIMGILMVVLVIGALFVGKTFLGGKSSGKDKDKEKAKVEVGVSLPMDEFLVNL